VEIIIRPHANSSENGHVSVLAVQYPKPAAARDVSRAAV